VLREIKIYSKIRKLVKNENIKVNGVHTNYNIIKMATKQETEENNPINKGVGAGGANTNLFGKLFENKTNMKDTLHKKGFIEKRMNKSKCGYYLQKRIDETKIIYLTQSGLKTYFKLKYNIILCRNPDEAYIIKTKDKCIIKILEKKEQHCEGCLLVA
jgi:hypothetical protein